MDIKTFLSGNKGKVLPKEYRGFNWGAFLLTFIWGYFHKAWVTFLAIPMLLIQLPLGLNLVILTFFQFYCGFKGNEWAYQHDWWKSKEQFMNKQKAWGIGAISANMFVMLAVLVILSMFAAKSPDNMIEYVHNYHCATVRDELKKGLPYITVSTTSEDIAKRFSEKKKNVNFQDNIVKYYADDKNSVVIYNITFEKEDGAKCNTSARNCTAVSRFGMDNEYFDLGECKFYYSNDEIMPDEDTQQALNKGRNIFNYL